MLAAMREVRILQPADQPALEAFALPRIASSMFLLCNSRSAGLVDRGERLQGTYAAAVEDGVPVGVAAMFWNGNAIVHAADDAVELCRHAARASGRPLAGVLGPSAQVAAVLEALGIGPAELQLDSIESLFELPLAELRVPEPLSAGAVQVRLAGLPDLPVTARLRVAYCIEALNERDTPQLYTESLQSDEIAIREGRLWVAEVGGAVVATTAFNALTSEAVQVGGVFTPRPLRSRGYARAAVAQSLLDARAGGARTGLLFTGDDNPAAQRAYIALGFERVGDYRISLLRTPRHIA